MTTIKDVANEAGVSVTTVSHVFSGKRKVAKRTAENVLAAAAKLGYAPDAAARKLATGRSTTVGLHFELGESALLLNPFFAQLLMGFAAASAERGFTFTLLPPEVTNSYPAGSMGGAIMVDPTPGNEWVPFLARQNCRVVTIGRYLGGVETSWVDNNHGEAMLEVTKHLAEQGYSRPVLLSVRHRMSYLADIEAAFQQGCLAKRLTAELVYTTDLSDRSARLTTRNLLQRPSPPDAVVCAIDHMALGVAHAAEELGITVPTELGVVGAGDTVLSRHASPKLTTVRVDPQALAREAIRLISDFWHNPTSPDQHIRLPSELIIRASSSR